jgi:hypothetical protein
VAARSDRRIRASNPDRPPGYLESIDFFDFADLNHRVRSETLGRKRAGLRAERQIPWQFLERVYPGVYGARRAFQFVGYLTDLDLGRNELTQFGVFRFAL